nr:hypothetical protein [Tanacetum cinerariifolium]
KIRGLKLDVEVRNNKIEYLMNELEQVKKEKEGLDNKLTGFESASKDLNTLLGSYRIDKNNEGLPEFANDTITDYSRPTPSIESNTSDLQNSNSSVSKHEESSSSIMSKPMIKFVKADDSPTVIKTNKVKTARKSSVKYAKMKNWPKNNFAHKNVKPKAVLLKTGRTPITVNRTNMNVAKPKRISFAKTAHSNVRRHFHGKSTVRTQFQVPRVSTVTKNFPTVDSKFSTAKPTFTVDLGNKGKAVKASACWIWRPKQNNTDKGLNCNGVSGKFQNNIDDKGYWDSGCSRHMTGNISYFSEYEPYDGGYVSFGQGGGKITGKGIIKIGKLKFENVCFVKDLKYNLFSVSQICDNKNSVLFTDSECIALGKDFNLKDDTNVLLRTHRQHNMYSIDLNNIIPHKNLTCLVAKASAVKGLPSKCYENDHTCVACLKGKQHKASYKTKLVNYVSKPLHTLHMDLFDLLLSKDEISGILRNFITEIENLKDLKVKIIRCDNGGEFKNKEMNEFCTRKGIKREFSNARTPQQNGVTKRKNRTLIEAAKTMLADAKLPITFWAEAVNTACYVQNKVLAHTLHHLESLLAIFLNRLDILKEDLVYRSLPKRNLKLNDEEGISSLPDAELFENLALMGYNNLPNQRFTFQKGLFSHQWKFLIHTIMQCLSPKSTGFNEFSSNIATAVDEGLAIPTEPHHTPSPQEQQSPHHAPSSPSNLTATTKLIPNETSTETPTLRQYSRSATRIAHLDAGQDRENINKTSALPHESTSRVTSLNADEGSMQQKLQELMELCIGLQRQQTKMDSKIKAQDLEISSLQARIKLLEDKDRGSAEPSRDDALIKGRSMEIKEEVEVKRSTELGSNDTEEMVNVLTSMEAANILTSRVVAVSVPLVVGVSTIGVPTVSGLFPTVSSIFTTASVVTSYSRRPRGILAKDKGKEKVVESEEPKNKKLQEHIDAQVAREMEEEIAREDQKMNEQLVRDDEIARIHAEEELKMLIDGLDRSNEVIAKHLQEYEQSKAELTIGEKIELINELVKYQDHHAKILKYQAQQSKPLLKKEQREFYMSVLRSHARWKTKHFRGMTLEEIKEKFIPVWKQIKDFVPMSSKEEAKRVKRKGLRLEQGSAKRMKTSEDVSEEDLKGMMQLVPVEEVYVKALQVKHPIINWEIHSEGKKDY